MSTATVLIIDEGWVDCLIERGKTGSSPSMEQHFSLSLEGSLSYQSECRYPNPVLLLLLLLCAHRAFLLFDAFIEKNGHS